jgi:hypothetical protein
MTNILLSPGVWSAARLKRICVVDIILQGEYSRCYPMTIGQTIFSEEGMLHLCIVEAQNKLSETSNVQKSTIRKERPNVQYPML